MISASGVLEARQVGQPQGGSGFRSFDKAGVAKPETVRAEK
jgi:hypothetical protein